MSELRKNVGFHTLNEIIESICYALGRKPPRLSFPVGPTHRLFGLIEKGSHAIGLKPPVIRGIIDKYTEDIAVDGTDQHRSGVKSLLLTSQIRGQIFTIDILVC